MLNNLIDLFGQFKDKESITLATDLVNIKTAFDEIKDPSQFNKKKLQVLSSAVGSARNRAIK